MHLRHACGAILLFVACGSSRIEHANEVVFGDVPIGDSRSVALVLTNSGTAAAQLTFTVDGDFSVSETTRTVKAGETTTLMVRFTPSELGNHTGTLSISGADIALSGRGTGPQLSVPAEVVLAPVALISGQPEKVITSKLILRNTGTAGSLLHVSPAVHARGELCVGTFFGSLCQPWNPPAEVDTQTLVEVPISLLASSEGARSWTVAFRSDDPVHLEVTTEVRARVESFEPCRFSAPTEVVLSGSQGTLSLNHLGPGTCLVRLIDLSHPQFLQLIDPGFLPHRLASGEGLTATIKARNGAPTTLYGTVAVIAAGTAPLLIPLRLQPSQLECLVMTPGSLGLGTVRQSCSSAERNVQLINICNEPLVIESVKVAAGAGEGPGGPNCPGTAPCPEFFIVSDIQPGTVVMPFGGPTTFSIKYQPINYGPDTGAVVVTTEGGAEHVLALQGRGDQAPHQVDTYRNDPLVVTDVLVMVDPSPSFVPRRTTIRANLIPLLTHMGDACHDTRWAFAAADGAPDAGVRLLANDAGDVWTRSTEPAFVERALSAFDSLPVGSEIEACIGPAADLMEDAGVRAGARFSGLCVTDALEQSPNPMGALQRIQALGISSWSAVAGVGSCAVEALDDGVHQSLTSAGGGSREDICDWRYAIGGFPCSRRTEYPLSGRADGAIQLRVDGQLISGSDWSWDATNNAIRFTPGREPPPGTTIEISYDRSCLP